MQNQTKEAETCVSAFKKSPHCCTQTSSIFPLFLGNLHGCDLDQCSLKEISHFHSLHLYVYQATRKYKILSTARVFSMWKSLVQSSDHNGSFFVTPCTLAGSKGEKTIQKFCHCLLVSGPRETTQNPNNCYFLLLPGSGKGERTLKSHNLAFMRGIMCGLLVIRMNHKLFLSLLGKEWKWHLVVYEFPSNWYPVI